MSRFDFHTTHWSVVLAAKGGDTKAKTALQTLCETYYAPVLRYVERKIRVDMIPVYGGRDAADLTHDFFAKLLEGKMFENIRREGAPFRTYLLGTVRHFLSQIRLRESADKRGGGFSRTSLPEQLPESSMADDAVFDRDWAQTMLARAMNTLQQSANETPVARLVPWLTQELDAAARSRLAAELDMTEVAVKVSLHRLRKKFREIIRSQIAETLQHPSEIDAELDHLIRVLRQPVS